MKQCLGILFILIFFKLEIALAQNSYFSFIQFDVKKGTAERHAGGLEVKWSIHSIKDTLQYRVTHPVLPIRRFVLEITIANRGLKDILISEWHFNAICPQNNMGLAWQEISFINLVTPIIPEDIYLHLMPGEKKTFYTAESDFYWCLPKDESSLMTSPLYISAIIMCSLLSQPQSNSIPSTTNSALPGPKATSGQININKNDIPPELQSYIDQYKQTNQKREFERAAELRKQILDIVLHAFPEKINEVNDLLNKHVISPSPKETKVLDIRKSFENSDHGSEFTDWLFIQSDKALQYRFKLVRQEGDIGYFQVQFRINSVDEIFCKHHTCLGYLLVFAYPSLDNKTYIETSYQFYNTNNQIYTRPELIPLVMNFHDGSKRFLRKNGFFFTNATNSIEGPANFFANCVDDILSNNPNYHRCKRFKKSEAIDIK